MKPEKRFTTILLSSSQLRMLRTGQMRLPVRVVKPVQLQHKAPVEVLPELPQEPTIGEFYVYKGHKVQCVEARGCVGCFRRADLCAEHLCKPVNRQDRKSVQFVPVH